MNIYLDVILRTFDKFSCIRERCVLSSSIAAPTLQSDDFGSDGRCESYLDSVVEFPDARKFGVTSLLALFENRPDHVILDCLAGDGYVSRVANNSGYRFTIINNDLSPYMVQKLVSQGLPMTWQSATNLQWIVSNSLNGVLLAYGVHHIPEASRIDAFSEAYRVLEGDGRLVFHDFESNSKMALFFREVVDEFSTTGHDCKHFESREVVGLMQKVGFKEVSFKILDDDFVFLGGSLNEAKYLCVKYVYRMYGLVRLGSFSESKTMSTLFELIDNILGTKLEILQAGGTSIYKLSVKRSALVVFGVRVKP